MKAVVITGSTRGIGLAMADAFLALGCSVAVSGRTQESVDKATAGLSAGHEAAHLLGFPCDVRDLNEVQDLCNAAQARFGRIDIWINNAGIGHAQLNFWELPADQIEAVVSTNLLGAMYGSKVALQAMLAQGWGAIYNLEGLGSSGPVVQGTSIYATTKAALRYLDKALAKEVEDTPLLVGAIRPGMVMTDLVTGPYQDRPEEWDRAKRIFNIIADRVETVAPWLAQRVLANEKNGACISWSSNWKMMGRFAMSPLRKRNVCD